MTVLLRASRKCFKKGREITPITLGRVMGFFCTALCIIAENTTAKFQVNLAGIDIDILRTRRKCLKMIVNGKLLKDSMRKSYGSSALLSVLLQQTQMPTFKSVRPEMTKFCSKRVYKKLTLHQINKNFSLVQVESICRKKKQLGIGENIFSFSQCFKNSLISWSLKVGIVWKGVEDI